MNNYNPQILKITLRSAILSMWREHKIKGWTLEKKITVDKCKLSLLHSTLFSAFLFVFSYSPFIMKLSIIWYLVPRNFFPLTFLLSEWPSQFLFPFFISYSIIPPSPTLSSTNAFFFILAVHFTCSILHHIRVWNASSRFCSLRGVQLSEPYNATLHTKHFTNLFLSSFSKGQGTV